MLKKVIKKSLALAATGALLMSTLAGCGASTNSGNSKSASSDKPIDLVWWTIGNEPKDYALVSEKINEYTMEKLNVNLQIKYASWGEYNTKMSKIVQSGEPFDIVFTSGIENYQDLLNKGYFLDLTELLPTVTPDLYNLLPEDLWEGVTIDGKILGVPAYKDSAQAQYWIWDKATVEELGIDYQNIETLKDLEPALQKMKEASPNEYPLILNANEGINGFNAAINGYDEIVVKPAIGISYDDESAKVVGIWEQQNVIDNLKILHDWFNKGYINPDAATLLELPKTRKVSSAQSFEGGWKDTEVGHKYFGPAYSTRTIQGSFLSISAGCKNPEAALKVIELVNTDEYFRNLLAFGIEGTHYEKTGDNTIKKLNDKYEVPAYTQGTFFNMYVQDPNPSDQWTKLQELQETAFSSPVLGFTFDSSSVKNQISACANIEAKYGSSLITGSVNPEEAIPKMMAELNAAGYQDIIAEAQRQVDEFLANKK
nr:ABC transporter substrate-binding protein [uncultured Tyzzerella sp.]